MSISVCQQLSRINDRERETSNEIFFVHLSTSLQVSISISSSCETRNCVESIPYECALNASASRDLFEYPWGTQILSEKRRVNE